MYPGYVRLTRLEYLSNTSLPYLFLLLFILNELYSVFNVAHFSREHGGTNAIFASLN